MRDNFVTSNKLRQANNRPMGENSPNLVTRLKGQAKARSKLKKGSFVNPSDKFLKKFFKKLYLYSISGLTRGQFSTSPYVQRFAPPRW
jgi:hypothetical protein